MVAIPKLSIQVGDLGGYIESEKCLSTSGNAWVSGNAKVLGNAKVHSKAWVSDNAQVYGNAKVSGDTKVSGVERIKASKGIIMNKFVLRASSTIVAAPGSKNPYVGKRFKSAMRELQDSLDEGSPAEVKALIKTALGLLNKLSSSDKEDFAEEVTDLNNLKKRYKV